MIIKGTNIDPNLVDSPIAVADEYKENREEQKENRFPPRPSTSEVPSDALSVLILVERIQNPRSRISGASLIPRITLIGKRQKEPPFTS